MITKLDKSNITIKTFNFKRNQIWDILYSGLANVLGALKNHNIYNTALVTGSVIYLIKCITVFGQTKGNGKGLKKLFISFAIFITSAALARTLHYGDISVELTDEKKTSPALHVQPDHEQTVYGAMYDVTAPQNTLRIEYNDMQYWVGPWCEPGNYLPTDAYECEPCGIGYYCGGGLNRNVCSGGIISCKTPDNAVDLGAPADMMNRFLTIEDVNESGIPETDISQWTLLSRCSDIICYNVPDRLYNTDCGCDVGTLQPGTYLFLTNYSSTSKNAEIAVFDHPVGYMLQHSTGVYAVLIDTDNPTYIAFTIRSLPYTSSVNNTNVSGAINTPGGLAIYKLE